MGTEPGGDGAATETVTRVDSDGNRLTETDSERGDHAGLVGHLD